jgi:methionyl-tRNA formyltransferase
MRVMFVTEEDPIYVSIFFETLFAEPFRKSIDIPAVAICRPFNASLMATAGRIWHTYGAIDFLRLLFKYALRRLGGKSVERLCRQAGLRVMHVPSVNGDEFLRDVRDIAPDVIVSVAAPEKFGTALLKSPKKCCLNVHSGRLPKYRGMLPTFWQMLHGESVALVTVHEMGANLDDGDVLGTAEYPIDDGQSLSDVISGTKRLAAKLVLRSLIEVADGRAQWRTFDSADRKYFGFPTGEDVRRFRATGKRML